MAVKRASDIGTRAGFCKLLVSLAKGTGNPEELMDYLKDIPIDQIPKKYDIKVYKPREDMLEFMIPSEFIEKNMPDRVLFSINTGEDELNFNIREVNK